jgi:hypothetical protein
MQGTNNQNIQKRMKRKKEQASKQGTLRND